MEVLGNLRVWNDGIEIEETALVQARNVASLPITAGVALMPDAHWGNGSCVGSVIATRGAVIPATTGVDLNCGMLAVKTNLKASELPDDLRPIRNSIERSIPVGMNTHNKGRFRTCNLEGQALSDKLDALLTAWENTACAKTIKVKRLAKIAASAGTLGGGNHFIELCLDEQQCVWIMLHSGSRGIGNQIGTFAISVAREIALKENYQLPDLELAWLKDGSPEFAMYVEALAWANEYATLNRKIMLNLICFDLAHRYPHFKLEMKAINIHHNYTNIEEHFGEKVWITRKGAVSAKEGELGIIPSSMGQPSYIVKGKGNSHAYCSCSHGAGRRMSRGQARKTFSNADLLAQTQGVECRKDDGVLDEIPGAYKDINQVIAAQSDLIEVVAKIKAVLCIKG